jgi:AcrR family transcriptional regulator
MTSRHARPYSLVRRQRTMDAGRERIVAAARELLEADDAEAFSIDAVARRARVARMTVYNQFASKAGLLEAFLDSIAEHEFEKMPEIFALDDPGVALDAFVALFGRFWTRNRRAHARLRAAAEHDDELAAAMTSRNSRRRRGLTELVKRFGARTRPLVPRRELVNVLYVLLSFETFDALAGEERTPLDVVPLVQKLARGVIGLLTSDGK